MFLQTKLPLIMLLDRYCVSRWLPPPFKCPFLQKANVCKKLRLRVKISQIKTNFCHTLIGTDMVLSQYMRVMFPLKPRPYQYTHLPQTGTLPCTSHGSLNKTGPNELLGREMRNEVKA